MTQKVIIDADPGIGDAVAIALALTDPEIEVLGITSTAGRVSGADASHNVQAIVEAVDPQKWPRLGSSSAVAPEYAHRSGELDVGSADLNGPHGMGDWEFNVAELHHARDSAKLMVELARQLPDEVTLLTLGPLTNVELACERAPDFLGLLKGLICLGGAVESGGDATAVAEFNVFANPDAARMVLRSPATKTLVPLDVSSQLVLTFEQFDRFPSANASRLVRFLAELLPFAFRAHHEHLGLEGIRLHEVVALAAISSPRLFSSRGMAFVVETNGELTRGMTVFDLRRIPQWHINIDVLCEAHLHGVLDYFNRIVGSA